MIKILIIFVLAVSVHGQHIRRCRRICWPGVQSWEICASENPGVSCIRMSRCQFEAENCRRGWRHHNQPPLVLEDSDKCRNISSPNSSGRCAAPPIRRTRAARPECQNLKCLSTSRLRSCYRSKRNNCRLLTNCQMQRLNCERGHLNRVEWTKALQCAGIKDGVGHRKCKPLRARG